MMTGRQSKQARWHVHANAVAPMPAMRGWLTDRMSLTLKLIAHSVHFRVRCLRQRHAVCLADEFAAVGLPQQTVVREREVLLECDGVPVVYAHTIVPCSATAADWPFFNTLGERSLGTTLFRDPRVRRGQLHFARLPASHPLAVRAAAALGIAGFAHALHARRCLYRRRHGVLLVTEVFLPSIAQVGVASCAAPAHRVAMQQTQQI